ncbi:MAG: SGNH/GDSL hydrolase family protein [Gammaproteobacteria bacterium]|jgi:tetratricopeptide (TPR) repeat protein
MGRKKKQQRSISDHPDPSGQPAPPAVPTGSGRRGGFLLLALMLPVLLLGAVEGALRALDVAPRIPLFIPHPQHPQYSLANPAAAGRLFSRPEAAPNVSIETGFFDTRRSSEALRLVVQGGSSAAGFPYGYGASPAAMLEQRLRRENPARRIEVISTAMSAVNSYALWEFSEEIIDIEPDAVLIYAGHNEFLGILGVGSAYSSSRSPGLTRLILRLRDFRLYRLLERMLSPVGDQAVSGDGGDGGEGGTLMARIAAERRIPMDSELYRRGVEQFEGNLDRILRRYGEAGIPVFVATLVSNEADQPPFISAAGAEGEIRASVEAIDDGEMPDPSARKRLEDLAAGGNADAAYALGRLSAKEGRTEAALQAFQRARDLDQLRFRAPTAFNRIIRERAAAHGATVVEAASAFRGVSPGGVIGHSLITEHLHPNADGYFILADSFHQALLETGLLDDGFTVVDESTARAEMPLSAVDRLFGEYKLLRLMADWPFVETRGEPVLPAPGSSEEVLARELYEQKIDWLTAHRRLKDLYRREGDRAEYLRVALILADAFPFSAADQFDAANALLAADRPLQAVRYLYQAAAIRPDHLPTWLALGDASGRSGLKQHARRAYQRVLEIAPGHPRASAALSELDRD